MNSTDTDACICGTVKLLITKSGEILPQRNNRYEAEGPVINRVTGYVLGILGFFAVRYILVPLLPGNILGYTMDRFVRMIYVMLIVPFAIKKSR